MSESSKSQRATGSKDPLDVLTVIDRLEVGPTRIESARLVTPYKVVQGNREDVAELSYRWEEDVFTPGDPISQNVANMIGVQIAFNYGLFCRQIVFHGSFDSHDRRLIEAMSENTSREIYVNKLLQANPFLTGSAAKLPPKKLRAYLRAQLVFPDSVIPTQVHVPKPAARAVDAARHAVLSSGGKDSLLTFGLLSEIGAEVHPIYVNEAGRHWFTALNAYRHFAAHIPNTARVWTNSDRIFTWMVRHLPFVRQDFANVRADVYPIRLWTVAVFIFGALPLLLKRGIPRLLIGNEYDTTLSLSHRGITHYNGLYDQSRFFDDALTRYYHRKGWQISQFSVIRPLSELVIEKILAERYPHLLKLQTSCHATHSQGDRVLPCGRCETCRRIVGMFSAMTVDPKICGYTPDQIKACIQEYNTLGIHQERVGARHLVFLLRSQGKLTGTSKGPIKAQRHPEVVKLRFDPQRSPPDCTPVNLREPLWRIFLEHAEGAVVKKGRVWVDARPLDDATMLASAYSFEGPAAASDAPASEGGRDARDSVMLAELTWPQAEVRFREVDLALLPVGSVEQHGPHLPLDTDAFDAEHLARQVAIRCSRPKPLVLPLISYGVAYHHEDFSGTVSVNPDTLAKLVYEVGMGVARQGITKLVIINGHGGNSPALKFAAQMINRDARIFTSVDSGETSDSEVAALVETRNDVHAGEIETSTSLATRPQLVDLGAAVNFAPEFSSRYLDFTSKQSVEWYARTAKISQSGVMGNPLKASADKGARIWDIMIRSLVEFVEEIKGMTLDEIYQRKY